MDSTSNSNKKYPLVRLPYNEVVDLDLDAIQDRSITMFRTINSVVEDASSMAVLVAESLAPFQNTVARINEQINESFKSITLISDYYKKQQDEINKMLTSALTLPLQNLSRMVDEATKVSFGLTNVNEYKKGKNEYLEIETMSSVSVRTPLFHYERNEVMSMKLEVMTTELKELKEENHLMRQDIKVLLDLVQKKNEKLYEIITLKYNKPSSKLIVNDKNVTVRGPNQMDLLGVLFSNKKTPSKIWNFDEVQKKAGQTSIDLREFNRSMYDACRRINEKVALATNMKDFLIYDMLTVKVNPIYLSALQ